MLPRTVKIPYICRASMELEASLDWFADGGQCPYVAGCGPSPTFQASCRKTLHQRLGESIRYAYGRQRSTAFRRIPYKTYVMFLVSVFRGGGPLKAEGRLRCPSDEAHANRNAAIRRRLPQRP